MIDYTPLTETLGALRRAFSCSTQETRVSTIVHKGQFTGLGAAATAVKETLEIIEQDATKIAETARRAKESIQDPVETSERIKEMEKVKEGIDQSFETLKRQG